MNIWCVVDSTGLGQCPKLSCVAAVIRQGDVDWQQGVSDRG